MFNKVKAISPQSDFILLITFENNENRYYDIKPLFNKWDIFNDLKNILGLYEQVKVDQGGFGISWNDDIDLSCNELYANSYLRLGDA